MESIRAYVDASFAKSIQSQNGAQKEKSVEGKKR
jgi:hypothetical protein